MQANDLPPGHESSETLQTRVALISARLERLPFGSGHAKVLFAAGSAHFFDAFDALTIAFVLPVLMLLWKLTPVEAGLLVSAGYAGQMVGALIAGAAAERYGRVRTLRWMIALLGLLSFASAFAWSYGVLILLRVVQGLGLGGETPVAATYINEVSPGRIRGRIVFVLQSTFALGTLLAAIVAVWLIPHYGWQSMFFVGTLPVLVGVVLPLLAPESPRWLASQGRIDEAESIVSEWETTRGPQQNTIDPKSLVISNLTVQEKSSFAALLARGLRTRTVGLWVYACCTSLVMYGIAVWMPTLYKTVYHVPVDLALKYALYANITAFIGAISGIFIIDRLGRRKTFLIGFTGAALPMGYLAFFGAGLPVETVAVLAPISYLFICYPIAGLYVYAPEVYPTHMRAIGAGAASSWLRIGSIVGPSIMGALLTYYRVEYVFGFLFFAAVAGALAILLTAVETTGKQLEEIA
ncbi:MFS transporter [Burkholderia gladioli]|uniref:MFS transporter n=1 Tax=Burkholderia gladioli TaxID=28095 RepID=UPI000F80A658|nr:MFS transporter [Burkholderia gladioli]